MDGGMLEQLLAELHNWFRVRDGVDGVHRGSYAIQNGEITLDFLREGQYFRIVGSLFNDGLHQYGPGMEVLRDEAFTGAVWALAVPEAVVELAGEIAAWRKKYGAVVDSPIPLKALGSTAIASRAGAMPAPAAGRRFSGPG